MHQIIKITFLPVRRRYEDHEDTKTHQIIQPTPQKSPQKHNRELLLEQSLKKSNITSFIIRITITLIFATHATPHIRKTEIGTSGHHPKNFTCTTMNKEVPQLQRSSKYFLEYIKLIFHLLFNANIQLRLTAVTLTIFFFFVLFIFHPDPPPQVTAYYTYLRVQPCISCARLCQTRGESYHSYMES